MLILFSSCWIDLFDDELTGISKPLSHAGRISYVAEPLKPVAQQGGGDAVSEAYIQALVHEHPACLPIAEIDAMFSARCRADGRYCQCGGFPGIAGLGVCDSAGHHG